MNFLKTLLTVLANFLCQSSGKAFRKTSIGSNFSIDENWTVSTVGHKAFSTDPILCKQ